MFTLAQDTSHMLTFLQQVWSASKGLWHPAGFITDFGAAEKAALQQFRDTCLPAGSEPIYHFLCVFHLLQAWKRRLQSPECTPFAGRVVPSQRGGAESR
jgi:hypothetical protein